MQKHFVKKGNSFVGYWHKMVQLFCLNIFKSYFTICDIMFFADKNKVNSIPLSQKLY
jgi:hypothetical protein